MNRTAQITDLIEKKFPDAECELNHKNVFELLIAVMLSAQTTDLAVNKVTENLFKNYQTLEDYQKADVVAIEEVIRRIGLYRNKAKNIKNCVNSLVDNFDSKVPKEIENLISLSGVGRKTANVVRAVGFDIPAIPVDTHVERIAKRLGLASENDSVLTVEKKLAKKLPKEKWNKLHHCFIFFGRYHCTSRRPHCDQCELTSYCNYYAKINKKKTK